MNTSNMLVDWEHSVSEVPSGAQALQLLETDLQFDVVVADYALPGMSGLDLATKRKQIKPELPIVLTGVYVELPPHKTFDFLRLGKPHSQEELAEALKVALNAEGADGVAPAS